MVRPSSRVFQQRSGVTCCLTGGICSLSWFFVFIFRSCSLAPNPRGWSFQSMSSRRFAYPRVLQFLKLLSSKDQTLLVRRNAFIILDLCLYVFDCVSLLHIQGTGRSFCGVAMDSFLTIHEGIAYIILLWHRNCWIRPILTWWRLKSSSLRRLDPKKWYGEIRWWQHTKSQAASWLEKHICYSSSSCFVVVMVMMPGLYRFYFPILRKVVAIVAVELFFVETAVCHRLFLCVGKWLIW